MQEVKVTWDDITHYNDWATIEEAEKLKPKRFQTKGWLIAITQKYVTIACTLDVDATMAVSNVMVIPKRALVKIEEDNGETVTTS